jgi:hypothetical protein
MGKYFNDDDDDDEKKKPAEDSSEDDSDVEGNSVEVFVFRYIPDARCSVLPGRTWRSALRRVDGVPTEAALGI